VAVADSPHQHAEPATVIEAGNHVSFADIARIALATINDAVLAVDEDGRIIYFNAVAAALTGCSRDRALARPVEEVFRIIDLETRRPTASPAARAISDGTAVSLELGSSLLLEDGSDLSIEYSAVPIRNRSKQIVGALIVFHDARVSRAMADKIDYLANHDCLTGLPNRLLFTDRLNRAVSMAGRHQRRVALLFIDLDHFKEVNDRYGHAAGDELLRNVSTAILSCVRATDTVARLGGDEFVILLTEVEQTGDAAQIANKVLSCCPEQEKSRRLEHEITLSIGISTYPEDGLSAADLMQCADAAMYQAKALGRNNFRFFDESAKRAPALRAPA
jgi:diguanylate cyclase (GGDEF)-like protein/PAS domain S-box-containing protein